MENEDHFSLHAGIGFVPPQILEHLSNCMGGRINCINCKTTVDGEHNQGDNSSMPPRSNWPNEDMWVRAVELRKSGLTYPQVTGRLVSEFNLEEIPSVDTVRRQVGVRLEVDSGSSALLTNHLIQLRWLASRVLAETGLDLVHLFSGDGVDVGRRLSAGFGYSALRIDRMPSRPVVSLVVEERQDFFLLTEHLSTIMPLSEAPDTLAKAMTRIGSLPKLRTSRE